MRDIEILPEQLDFERAAQLLGVDRATLPRNDPLGGTTKPPCRKVAPLSDEEWSIISSVMPPPEKCQSAVSEREFVDFCLLAARIGFRWSLLRADPALETEANRKKLSRFSLHQSGSIWSRIYDAVRGKLLLPREELFRILAVRSEEERKRVAAYRQARLQAILADGEPPSAKSRPS